MIAIIEISDEGRHMIRLVMILGLWLLLLCSCAYNPFISNNHTTGRPEGALIGAGVGAGSVALLGGSRPLIALAGLGGGALGYYVTTLRYDAGGIMQSGGQVYQVGEFVGINIPSDDLFEANTDEFLPGAGPILDSTVAVLDRYPKNNILISGNTSGFGRPKWEQQLSQKRAQKVSAYLWNAGINDFKKPGNDLRKLTYVGYGNYFPIASDLTLKGIRENSHIQITSYPSSVDLKITQKQMAMNNVGALNDSLKGYKDDCKPESPC